MGLPLVTRMGESFVSRVGASLLSALEMPELITTSIEEYESMAIKLALNPTQLMRIKNKLKQKIGTTSLFNSRQFTRDLESVYQLIYERYQKGLAPDHIF
jgi:protein O-GlcNAc transferase